MSKESPKKPRKKAAGPKKAAINALLGVGLDNSDGHKRITTGEKFLLVGGSEETHGRMTETVLKTFEELRRRAKSLETVEPRELSDIVQKSTPR